MNHPPATVRARGLEEIRGLLGTELGPTPWHPFGPEELQRFAALADTVRPVPAAASSAGSTTGAAFALACGPRLGTSLVVFDGFAHGLNYGYDRVELLGELPLGGRFRMRQTVVSADPTAAGVHVVARQTFETEDADGPFCVALAVSRLFD